jgi:hypothetical protein
MRALLVAAAISALAAAQIGCGSSKSTTTSGSGTSRSSSQQISAAVVQSCLSSKNLDFKQNSRSGGVTNFQVRITSTTTPITVNLNVFPTAQAASTYFNRIKSALTATGGDLQLHGNVMVATTDVVLPANRPDVAPAENCASG